MPTAVDILYIILVLALVATTYTVGYFNGREDAREDNMHKETP